MKKVLLFTVLAASLSAHAQTIYKYQKNGVTVYSTTPTKGAAKVDLPPITVVAGRRDTAPTPSTGTAKHHGMADTSDAQKTREQKRSDVLEEELRREQAELEKAEKTLVEQESMRGGDEKNYQKVLERVQPYKDAVALHKKNIESIKKEMATNR